MFFAASQWDRYLLPEKGFSARGAAVFRKEPKNWKAGPQEPFRGASERAETLVGGITSTGGSVGVRLAEEDRGFPELAEASPTASGESRGGRAAALRRSYGDGWTCGN